MAPIIKSTTFYPTPPSSPTMAVCSKHQNDSSPCSSSSKSDNRKRCLPVIGEDEDEERCEHAAKKIAIDLSGARELLVNSGSVQLDCFAAFMADMKLPEDAADSVPVHVVDFTDLNEFLSCGSSIGSAKEYFWSTLFTMQQETY